MHLAFRAQAFGPLNRVDWTVPPGVSAIVGPNRAGKSTLLALPEFIRISIDSSVNDAVKQLFGGTAYFRNLNAPATSSPGVGLSVETVAWDIDITIAAGAIAPLCAEQLKRDDRVVFSRAFGSSEGKDDSDVKRISLGPRVLPAICSETAQQILEQKPEVFARDNKKTFTLSDLEFLEKSQIPQLLVDILAGSWLASTSIHFASYRTYNYRIQHLLRYGSTHSSDTALERSGENVFPLLRNWRDDSETEHRFDFVISTLREAFPHVKRLDFEQAGDTVTMMIRDRRWPDRKIPISRESTGLITALLQLCAVASCKRGGMVTIDELETSLHPHAIRVLIAAFRRWATEHDLRIVLATQSETVLDQFHDDPGQIYVIEPKQETSPRSLTDMFDAEYLAQFSLGDLFSHLEFGSNGDLDVE
ncbi:MAG: AAA family ATPase [Nannocystis sp.]|nr:AAA family ATPase [Nannocystis sp.]MBA3546983.1 AAA family ATPase [Nannocystis sp.]